MAGHIIVIDGGIGAGKSALLTALSDRLRLNGYTVCAIPEPVDRWGPILEKFYTDPARWGYTFQTYVYTTRIQAIRQQVHAHPACDIYILERSPATDRIFMAVSAAAMDPAELVAYKEWANMHDMLLPFPLSSAISCHLRTSVAACMRRVKARARRGEVAIGADDSDSTADDCGVTLQYQERLLRAHTDFFGNTPSTEFPELPSCPYVRRFEVGPELADLDYRHAGRAQDMVLEAIIGRWRALLA